MLAKTIRKRATRSQIAPAALALAVVLSACGATTASQSLGEPSDVARDSTSAQAQLSAGSLDYSTAQHMGLLAAGAGASSLDYNTAQHLGRLNEGAGSSSLDYDTARHIGRVGAP
jgi:hypothetical protein